MKCNTSQPVRSADAFHLTAQSLASAWRPHDIGQLAATKVQRPGHGSRAASVAQHRPPAKRQSSTQNSCGHLLAHVFHLYIVTCEQREELQGLLEENQVESIKHFPINHQEPCRDISRDPQGLGSSESHASISISLPSHPQMAGSDIAAVIAAVNSIQGVWRNIMSHYFDSLFPPQGLALHMSMKRHVGAYTL